MQYVLTFLEGFISFISPCMLPMLPLYVSYFAGDDGKRGRVPVRTLGFVMGFTVVFTAMGVFAGSLGSILVQYRTLVNVISGLIVVVLGLSYLEVVRIPFLKGIQGDRIRVTGFFSACLFGAVYSVSLTPCVGAFLGSALMLASSRGGALEGMILLLVYSLGLGIPFLISAVLIHRLQEVFGAIKRHYGLINKVCGIFLILMGILMMCGWLGRILGALV